MPSPKVLVFAGSVRRQSFNGKLAALAAHSLREAGGQVTLLQLADFALPLFDQDLEAEHGLPEAAKRLQEIFLDHDGLLLACPEYNSSITPLMKNTIDWVSRAHDDRPGSAAFHGKVAALVSASPGALGGLRGLRHVREILGNIGVIVLPAQLAVSSAASAFSEEGQLKDDYQRSALGKVTAGLLEILNRAPR